MLFDSKGNTKPALTVAKDGKAGIILGGLGRNEVKASLWELADGGVAVSLDSGEKASAIMAIRRKGENPNLEMLDTSGKFIMRPREPSMVSRDRRS